MRHTLAMLMVMIVLGCACSDRAGEEAADNAAASRPAESDDERPAVTRESLRGTAVVEGVVRFVGTPPGSPAVRVSGDAYCVDIHGDAFVDPDIVLDADGHLQNVFVYLAEGVPEHRYAIPDDKVTIDQSGCMYVPRVVGVQTGQTIAFRNSDRTLHNVHAIVDRQAGNKAFNFGMPGDKGVVIERIFQVPEIMVRIKCDVHPWMVAWVGVLPHAWHSVTDATGRFHIGQVPDGDYVVEAWHETFGRQRLPVTVAGGVAAPLEIVFRGPVE